MGAGSWADEGHARIESGVGGDGRVGDEAGSEVPGGDKSRE